MVFTTNQNRHLYVANAYNATVNEQSPTGTIGNVKVTTDGIGGILSFSYKSPKGVLKSDRIQLKNLDYAKAFTEVEMREPFKSVKVVLNNDPITAQDYVLRIDLKQFYGISDMDTYSKDAVVHATSGMTAAQFYTKMAEQLNLSFSREVGATKTSNPYLTFTAAANGLTITGKAQPWTRGLDAGQNLIFDVFPTTVYDGMEDVVWGTVTDVTPSKANVVVTGANATGKGNGTKMADLEWFCMGERGDQYRGTSYPNVIPTEYLVDATKEYSVLEIHHAFTDTGVNSYRSEKDITIIFPVVSGSYTEINKLITAINTAAKTTINTLGD
jgi:ATP-dependent Clp protease adapter protein ClpS